MSNALAIAGTTEILRTILEARLRSLTGKPDLQVTAQPPDLAGKDNPSNEKPQLNLFLYQTVLNGAWRNLDMPRQVRPGETGQPPLALDLHYVLTAYGRESGNDGLSQFILGGAMSLLHDHPVLSRAEINQIFSGAGLHEQFELLKITPLPMSLEDMSKLWMIFQTQYRISVAYEVTVVLIDSAPAPAPLPVLKRGKTDRGPTAVAGAAANLREIRLPRSQSAARLGEELAIAGDQLTTEATQVRFTSARVRPGPPDPILLDPRAGAKPGKLAVQIPNTAQDIDRWMPGFYTLALVQTRADVPHPLVSNELPFALAPQITVEPKQQTIPKADEENGIDFELKLTCVPRILPEQRVIVLFGSDQFAPSTVTIPDDDATKPTEITVALSAVKQGDYVVRLRVDGVDSIPVTYQGTPPVPGFDPDQTVSVSVEQ